MGLKSGEMCHRVNSVAQMETRSIFSPFALQFLSPFFLQAGPLWPVIGEKVFISPVNVGVQHSLETKSFRSGFGSGELCPRVATGHRWTLEGSYP